MTSITPGDDYDWQDHDSSWLGIAVAFLTVALALTAALALGSL
jgi:hypothetical protein